MPGAKQVQANDPLAELRGLQLPDVGGFWPPAPIWWLLACLLLGLLIWATWQWRNYKQARAYRKQALATLQKIDANNPDCLHQCQRLLRRAALTAAPAARNQIAPLSGKAWFDYLNTQCSNMIFDPAFIDDVAHAHYRDANTDNTLNATMLQSTQRWLKEHRRC